MYFAKMPPQALSLPIFEFLLFSFQIRRYAPAAAGLLGRAALRSAAAAAATATAAAAPVLRPRGLLHQRVLPGLPPGRSHPAAEAGVGTGVRALLQGLRAGGATQADWSKELCEFINRKKECLFPKKKMLFWRFLVLMICQGTLVNGAQADRRKKLCDLNKTFPQ